MSLVVGLAGLAAWIGGTGKVPPVPAASEQECLVLIDLDAFSCGLCLESLLAFCRAVPAAVQESRLRGILLLRPSAAGASSADPARIARKKWEGFRRANGIRFPALCDEARAFARPEKAGALVLVLDGPGSAVRSYPLPLKPAELADILRILGQ
jgi:hypothetical protein